MIKQVQPAREAPPAKQTRNGLCHCGSGAKYKKCCGAISAQGAVGPAPAPTAQDHYLRGVQLLQSGQIAAAKAMLLAAIHADETHFGAFHALGSALLQGGQFAQAAGILDRALALRPGSAAANHDLAMAYDRLNLHEEAIAAYRKAVDLEPGRAAAQLRLAELYVMYSRYEEASHCFDRAADVNRNTTNARLYRADAHKLRGDEAGAEQWARRAVALDAASDAAHGTLAGLLYTQGRFEEAEASFENALRLNPASAMCWDGLAHCRKYADADSLILNRMQAVLARGDLDPSARMTIHFAMGKVLDDCGDYGRAMAHFDSANALRARDLVFDRAGFSAMVDRTIARFTPDFIARHAAYATSDDKPLFIVGMYRSGTTLTEQILSSHAQIAAGGELTVWAPADLEIDEATATFDPMRTHAAIAKYLSALQSIGPSAARVTDKLPVNFFRLGAIHALMPNARIIHCQRDPIDTCLSIYTTLFRSRLAFAARKDDLVFCYRLYRRLMAHWQNVLPHGVMMDVPYERMVEDRAALTREMVAFAGLDWDAGCMQPDRNTRAISTSSAWQVRQPVYMTSVQRWRRYEPWLGELRELLSDTA